MGLWRDGTLGFDEPLRHQGQEKTNDEPPYGGVVQTDPAGDARPCRGQSIYTVLWAPGGTFNDMVGFQSGKAMKKVHIQK